MENISNIKKSLKEYIIFILFLLKTTTLLQSKVYLIKIYPIDALVIAVVIFWSICNRYILRILLKILISNDFKFESFIYTII